MWEVRSIVLRDAGVAEEVVRIQQRAYVVEAELIEFEAIPNLTETADDVRQLDLASAAAFDGGAMVGFIGYRRYGVAVEIDRLAVDPAAFRRGIGRALLQYVLDEHGPVEYAVSTGAANTPAIRLYESAGFRRTSEEVLPGGLRVVHLRHSDND